jgi:hypothetical protein
MEESKYSHQSTAHTLDEVKLIIGGKADLYEAAVRNGWFLPKYKSTIITEQYLQSVIFGRVYCPKYSEIRLVPCPRGPDKNTLLRDFRKITSSQKLSTGIDENHVPDKFWLLSVLGTHDPSLPYFQKGYVPPAKVASIQSFSKVELPENFLE